MSCRRCGRCCANVLMLNKKEVETIRKYVKENNIELHNHTTIMDKEDKNICPFLRDDKKCSIYPVRASICRNYECEGDTKFMNYSGVKAINMLFTFSEEKPFFVKAPDLTEINEHLKMLQERMGLKKWEDK